MATEKPAEIVRVRAIRPGFLDGRRIRADEEFDFVVRQHNPDGSPKLGKWMESANAPRRKPKQWDLTGAEAAKEKASRLKVKAMQEQAGST